MKSTRPSPSTRLARHFGTMVRPAPVPAYVLDGEAAPYVGASHGVDRTTELPAAAPQGDA